VSAADFLVLFTALILALVAGGVLADHGYLDRLLEWIG